VESWLIDWPPVLRRVFVSWYRGGNMSEHRVGTKISVMTALLTAFLLVASLL